MQNFAHVIAEINDGTWLAWFTDEPHHACSGDDWAGAVASLIDIHGSPQLRWELIEAIEATTCEGHAEFLIPYSQRFSYPVSLSLN